MKGQYFRLTIRQLKLLTQIYYGMTTEFLMTTESAYGEFCILRSAFYEESYSTECILRRAVYSTDFILRRVLRVIFYYTLFLITPLLECRERYARGG